MDKKYKLVNGELLEYAAEDYAIEEVTVEYIDPELYKKLRAAEYPSITDQLDIIYHKGIDAWKAEIATIKARYPKP